MINSEEKSNLRSEAELGTSVFRSHLKSVQGEFLGILVVRRGVLSRWEHVGMKRDGERVSDPEAGAVEEVDVSFERTPQVIPTVVVLFRALVYEARPPTAPVPRPHDSSLYGKFKQADKKTYSCIGG